MVNCMTSCSKSHCESPSIPFSSLPICSESYCIIFSIFWNHVKYSEIALVFFIFFHLFPASFLHSPLGSPLIPRLFSGVHHLQIRRSVAICFGSSLNSLGPRRCASTAPRGLRRFWSKEDHRALIFAEFSRELDGDVAPPPCFGDFCVVRMVKVGMTLVSGTERIDRAGWWSRFWMILARPECKPKDMNMSMEDAQLTSHRMCHWKSHLRRITERHMANKYIGMWKSKTWMGA